MLNEKKVNYKNKFSETLEKFPQFVFSIKNDVRLWFRGHLQI